MYSSDRKLILIRFRPTSLGKKSANISIVHNESDTPVIIPLSGYSVANHGVFINPSFIRLLGAGNTREIRIYNAIHETLTIHSIMSTDSNFQIFGVGMSPFSLNLRQEFTFRVMFLDLLEGEKSASLIISHSASDTPHIIPLAGVSSPRQPAIQILPIPQFGNVALNETSELLPIDILNVGNEWLLIDSMWLLGDDADYFTIIPTELLPINVMWGSFLRFNVQFSPKTLGEKTARVFIQHNAGISYTIINLTETGVPTTSVHDIDEVPRVAALLGNFPNPFNPITSIRYQVSGIGCSYVHIEVFNIRGQRIRTLLDGSVEFGAGRHSVIWDGRDDGGRGLGSGVYFYRMRVGEYVSVRRMVLVK